MRNLGLIAALWMTALLPFKSLALGLGEIEVTSFLNQPLSAKIDVLSARPGEIDDLLVSLASRDAFSRAGLERPQHLSELRFSVQKSEEGDTATILVSTRSAVKEPFLNFLVEADWSKGRLLREFTVLLDPPFYADQPPAPAETVSAAEPAASVTEESTSMPEPIAETAGSTDSGTEPIAMSQDSSVSQAASPPASTENVANESQNIIEGDVLVVKGDTLWGIASRYKDANHSMAQVMLAFQRANPDAFTDGNINNMKLGAVLRAPSAAEIDALDNQAAYAEVLQQNGLWDEYVARVTGVDPTIGGSASATDGSGSEEVASDGELSLLLPGEGDTDSTGTGDSNDLNELRTKLALAEEELEASRIENQDLESRIAELQLRLSKVEELQKMVEIEDDSLAQIQAGQTGDQADQMLDGESEDSIADDAGMADESATMTGESVGDEPVQDEEAALIEELLAEEAAAQAEEAAILADDEGTVETGETVDGESEAMGSDGMSDEEPLQPAADEMVAEDETVTVTPPPAPVIITEGAPSSEGSSMLDGILPPNITAMIPSLDGLLADPILLAGIGGVILLLLILVLVKRRKAAQDDDALMAEAAGDDLFSGDEDNELTPIHLADEDQLETDIKVPDADDVMEDDFLEEAEEEDEFAATAIISAADMPEAEAPPSAASAPEQDDVLNEVDVYLAYGLYDNAEDLLNSSLSENPERADYRSKLLDTYFATKKADAFVKEAQNLKSMGDAAKSYWDRVQIMGYELAPDNALFSDAKDSGLSAADLEIAKPQEADFDLGANDEDDTNFSSTDFNLGDSAGDDTGGEAGTLESTLQIPSGNDNETADDLIELPEDIGDELEFSMDDVGADDSAAESDETELPGLDFEDDELSLPEDDGDDADLPLSDDVGRDDTFLDLDILGEENAKAAEEEEFDLDDAVQIAPPDEDDPAMAETAIITPNYEDTEVFQADEVAADGDEEDISSLDLGMEDTSMKDGDETSEETGELLLDSLDSTGEIELASVDNIESGELMLDESDDDEDISIIDFGGDDFEGTGEIPVLPDDADGGLTLDDDEADDNRTGTFAPGDFDEPTAAVDSLADIDDMDDLMLPDDVDEVSTKLDLARAFIDMGDTEGARGSLEEVMSEGNAEQKAEAKSLLDQI